MKQYMHLNISILFTQIFERISFRIWKKNNHKKTQFIKPFCWKHDGTTITASSAAGILEGRWLSRPLDTSKVSAFSASQITALPLNYPHKMILITFYQFVCFLHRNCIEAAASPINLIVTESCAATEFTSSFLARNEAMINPRYPALSPRAFISLSTLLQEFRFCLPRHGLCFQLRYMLTASLGLVSVWKIKRPLVLLWGFSEGSS